MPHNNEYLMLLAALFTFLIIVIASNELAKIFQKIKLPLITGFIAIGIIAGPGVLNLLQEETLNRLRFLEDIALAFIALAAGSEMFLKDLQGKWKYINKMAIAQIVFAFVLGVLVVLPFDNVIPFLNLPDRGHRLAVALLISVIFIAPSLASALAVINELRAKGPFSKVSMGVIILKDIFVIILFTIVLSVSLSLINDHSLSFADFGKILLELAVSVFIGWIWAKIFKFVFSLKINDTVESAIFLALGWALFGLKDVVAYLTERYLCIHFYLEPLLSGIVAGFLLTNKSQYRLHLQEKLESLGPYVYVAFFTLIGAKIDLNVLIKFWQAALVLFLARLLVNFVSSLLGCAMNKEFGKRMLFSWTPYIAQAGISLGLIAIIGDSFPDFGREFETIMVAVIVINQFVGPPLMKWAIISLGEAHVKGRHVADEIKDVAIFGFEQMSLNLAKYLKSQGWEVKIITDSNHEDVGQLAQNARFIQVADYSYQSLKDLKLESTEAAILLENDAKNYEIASVLYEHFGLPNIVVRLQNASMYEQFAKFNALVVEPSSAIANVLVQAVKSPHGAAILLGFEQNQQILDIEVLNPEVHDKPLRDIRLPLGVLVLSVTRDGESILTHGYTRLKLNDIVTVMGQPDQLEQTRLKLQ